MQTERHVTFKKARILDTHDEEQFHWYRYVIETPTVCHLLHMSTRHPQGRQAFMLASLHRKWSTITVRFVDWVIDGQEGTTAYLEAE